MDRLWECFLVSVDMATGLVQAGVGGQALRNRGSGAKGLPAQDSTQRPRCTSTGCTWVGAAPNSQHPHTLDLGSVSERPGGLVPG